MFKFKLEIWKTIMSMKVSVFVCIRVSNPSAFIVVLWSGIETTPKWAGNTSLYQIHISSDIAYSLRQYLYVTEDTDMVVNRRGLELAMEVARFWQSRVVPNDDGKAEILG